MIIRTGTQGGGQALPLDLRAQRRAVTSCMLRRLGRFSTQRLRRALTYGRPSPKVSCTESLSSTTCTASTWDRPFSRAPPTAPVGCRCGPRPDNNQVLGCGLLHSQKAATQSCVTRTCPTDSFRGTPQINVTTLLPSGTPQVQAPWATLPSTTFGLEIVQ